MSVTLALIGALAAAVGTPFFCTPVAVYDGDGPIWCAEGPRIRLAGIAARELDETCRPGHPCPRASGATARDALVRLLGGPRGRMPTGHIRVRAARLRCISQGPGKGTRTAALCRSATAGDLSCAMLQTGTVVRWRGYGGDRLCR